MPLALAAPAPTQEILLYRRVFVPQDLPVGTVTRCANCKLVDPTQLGHDPVDCLDALKAEVARLQAENDRPRGWKTYLRLVG